MSYEEAQTLKPGEMVIWDGNAADTGKVITRGTYCIEILWHKLKQRVAIHPRDMGRVDRAHIDNMR